MPHRRMRLAASAAAGCAAILFSMAAPYPAQAHPHVWITGKSEIVIGADRTIDLTVKSG